MRRAVNKTMNYFIEQADNVFVMISLCCKMDLLPNKIDIMLHYFV